MIQALIKLGRAVDREPGLLPGENLDQTSTGCDPTFSRLVQFYDELGRAVNRQPGLPPGELFEQTCIDESASISSFCAFSIFIELILSRKIRSAMKIIE